MEGNETDKIGISRETFDQFKAMGRELIELKATVKQQADLIANYKVAYELVAHCIFSLTGTFGLNDASGMIRPEILAGEENPMASLIKEIGGLMTAAMLAETNKSKKEQLELKFAFFRYLPQVAEFYKHQQGVKITIPEDVLAALPKPVADNLRKTAA